VLPAGPCGVEARLAGSRGGPVRTVQLHTAPLTALPCFGRSSDHRPAPAAFLGMGPKSCADSPLPPMLRAVRL